MKKPTQTQTFHLSRLVLFSLLAVALLAARGDSGNALRLTYEKNVLAYASNMTITDLLRETNAARSVNGLKPLTLANALNTSAQLKANDMIDKNYWSHIAPDGTQPWHWFEQAGYTYSLAGENLAYGFDNGNEVGSAWMNSPAHKANIVGDYDEVGFGIASSANFQGGKNTVVVAHYAKQRAPETATLASTADDALSSSITTQTSSSTTIFELLKQGQAPMIASISFGLIAIAAAGFALTHRAFTKHAFREGKKFALHHPLFDVAAVSMTIGIILTTTVGYLL